MSSRSAFRRKSSAAVVGSVTARRVVAGSTCAHDIETDVGIGLVEFDRTQCAMPVDDIGALRRADEGLNHQIVDTFATVAESDHAWTEKIWASLARIDGSLQIDFGLGKYQNRGIIDGFGGISRGREQWTVRASRELRTAPEDASVGPVHYEVVEPLERIRFRLEPNDTQPIAFDVVLSGVTPPFFENRNRVRNRRTGRVDVDVVRYHQGGWASGTVTVDGETHEVRTRRVVRLPRPLVGRAPERRRAAHRPHPDPDRPTRHRRAS